MATPFGLKSSSSAATFIKRRSCVSHVCFLLSSSLSLIERCKTRTTSKRQPLYHAVMRSSMSISWLAALVCAIAASAHVSDAAADDIAAGPPLWLVMHGDHELWLFGTLSTVPENFELRSGAVEGVIATSQAVLLPPGVRSAVSLKPAHLIRTWRRIREMSRNPPGQTLADVLPPALYDRYAALRTRYSHRGRHLDQQRPIIAATRIYQDALDELGLASAGSVLDAIERMATRADIEPTDAQLHVDPNALLDEAARVPLSAELDCFVKALDSVEHVEQIVARARAWVDGDVAALRRFDYVDIRRDCLAFPGWPAGFEAALAAADDQWFAAAERSLTDHRSTFGTLDLRELMAEDGLLARFRAHGYEVREP